MEETELLKNIVEMAEKEGKRVDSYISLISDYLRRNSAHWTTQHEKIFDEMLNEIQSSRKYRKMAYIGVAVLMCVSLVLGISNVITEHAKKNNEQLIQDIKNSQLAVRLEPSRYGLAVVYDKDSLAVKSDVLKQKAEKLYRQVGTLGIHYDLGPERELKTKIMRGDSLGWLVCPAGLDEKQVLGKIILAEKHDVLARDLIQQGVDIHFPDLENFFVSLSGYESHTRPKAGKPEEMEQYIKWKVRFGEKNNDSIDFSEDYEIPQTDSGRIEVEPFLVRNPRWRHFYILTVGLGRLGEDSGRIQAWNLNSVVRRFGFQTD